jgi:hypothetical protein
MVRSNVSRCLGVDPGESTVLTYRQDTCDSRAGAADTALIGREAKKMSVPHKMELRYTECKFSLKKH